MAIIAPDASEGIITIVLRLVDVILLRVVVVVDDILRTRDALEDVIHSNALVGLSVYERNRTQDAIIEGVDPVNPLGGNATTLTRLDVLELRSAGIRWGQILGSVSKVILDVDEKLFSRGPHGIHVLLTFVDEGPQAMGRGQYTIPGGILPFCCMQSSFGLESEEAAD